MFKYKHLGTIWFRAALGIAVSSFLLVAVPESLPTVESQTGWGPINDKASLNGTPLTYYPAPSAQRCQSDCSGNPNCKGFNFIRAGAYNRNDPAMCYLISQVTNSVPSSCCISAVKTSGASTATYIGCFKDTSSFDLNGLLVRSRNNTIQGCAETCRARGFAFAGVQYGESCLCGNTYGRYGAATNCNMRCTGDSRQICGGINANSIYSTGVVAGGGGCPTDFTIQAPASAAAGSRINIKFGYSGQRPTGQTHWIGLFPAGSNQYREWFWVKDVQGCEASFGGAPAGDFEFRYFLDGGYDKIAARTPIRIN